MLLLGTLHGVDNCSHRLLVEQNAGCAVLYNIKRASLAKGDNWRARSQGLYLHNAKVFLAWEDKPLSAREGRSDGFVTGVTMAVGKEFYRRPGHSPQLCMLAATAVNP